MHCGDEYFGVYNLLDASCSICKLWWRVVWCLCTVVMSVMVFINCGDEWSGVYELW